MLGKALMFGTPALVAIAIAAGLFLAPAATVSLLRALASGVIELARDAVVWVKSNWWRALAVLCGVVAVGLGLALQQEVQDMEAKQLAHDAAVIAIRNERDRAFRERDAASEALVSYEERAAADYARITAELKAQQEANADAMADLRAQEARAAKSKAAWWRVYEGRSDQCKAAQEALDVACKGLGEL